jgi:dinuclear metal center YbgI/SA1388 family protein
MTLSIAEVVARLAARTRPERAAAWDNVGLQVGDPDAPVHTITVVHEVTESVTRQLESSPVDLVVAYHPLLFRPAARLVPDRSPSGRATRLLRAGVAVVVTHTDFDVMPGGMSDAMADALGISDVTGFGPVAPGDQVKVVTFLPAGAVDDVVDALSRVGAGRIGQYEQCAFTVHGVGRFVAGAATNPAVGEPGTANTEPEVRLEMVAPRGRLESMTAALVAVHPYEEPGFDIYPVESNHALGGRVGSFDGSWRDLVASVQDRFRPDGLRLAPIPGAVPRRVAVSPGAGESRIAAAAAAGCDVLVSGDISHHRVVEANDRGLSIIDPGHAATERPGIERLRALVRDVLRGDAVDVNEPPS